MSVQAADAASFAARSVGGGLNDINFKALNNTFQN